MARSVFYSAKHWLPAKEFTSNSSKRLEAVREETALEFDESVLIPVMTDLYRDPANTFIGIPDMAFLARDKLRGFEIEDRLRRLRKAAVEWKKALERMDRKRD